MRAEVVAVGTELLLGQIANTNARWMSERLAAIGADVLHHQAVGDNLDRIVEAIRLAASRADVVILTGGLGPTQDDITRDALGVVVGTPMVRHPELEELLREKFRSFGRREMPESNLKADVPEGVGHRAVAGHGAGPRRRSPSGVRVYAVPGVPEEMVEMMEGTILPELAARGTAVVRSRSCGAPGSASRHWPTRRRPVHRVGEPHDRVPRVLRRGEGADRGQGGDGRGGEALIEPVAEEVRRRIGDEVFTSEDESLEEAVVRLLSAAGRRSRAPSR